MKKIGKTIRRRRREFKTDYKSRLGLLKSGKQRVVIRKTNKYILIQLVESDIAQDKVIKSMSSKLLLNLGWPAELSGSLKGMAACYLTGVLFASQIEDKKGFILDIGLHRNVQGNRVYAALKGIIDGGIVLPHSEEAFPKDERINSNEKISKIINKIREKIANG